MKKKNKKPPIVKMAIFSVITAFAWIGFEVYRALTLEDDPVVPPEVLEPIDPNLDTANLNSLPQRIYLNEDQISDTVISNPIITGPKDNQSGGAEKENEETANENLVSEESTTEAQTNQ